MKQQKKLTLITLILMIFTSVFGFANMPRSYYLMGYGAIPWFIFGAVAFFIPYAFMMVEYGSAFKSERGGIYSWMERSVGPKYAFIGIFMWYSSYLIWMVNICFSIWIPLSNTFFGVDRTSELRFLGLDSTKSISILGIFLILLTFFISRKGIGKISKITSIGGIACTLLNLLLILASLIIIFLNKGVLSQPINSIYSFVNSPNNDYKTIFSMLSFLVFSIFAFGGIEMASGLVDETENPEKNFSKGIIIAAIIISIGYSVGIFCIGIFANWDSVLSGENVNMANVAYIVMNNLGFQLGISMGFNNNVSIEIGIWIARFVGLSMFLSLMGAFFTVCYSPLKQLIEGTPKYLWPTKMSEIDKNGIPQNAMVIQSVLVVIILILISTGGRSAKILFEMLVLMTNVAMTIPCLFLSIAFISFKKKESIEKPFEVYRNKKITFVISIIVTATVGFANLFTIIEPAMRGDYFSTMAMIAGPLIFSIMAIIIYILGIRKKECSDKYLEML